MSDFNNLPIQSVVLVIFEDESASVEADGKHEQQNGQAHDPAGLLHSPRHGQQGGANHGVPQREDGNETGLLSLQSEGENEQIGRQDVVRRQQPMCMFPGIGQFCIVLVAVEQVWG
eukprot:Lithocolla_globosa_v1_NODE_3078_length_1771_cov_15.138112.p2 type:complete len:116 gc:universal NODE_3078_length_1771_cov_15.138112:819-472(-)